MTGAYNDGIHVLNLLLHNTNTVVLADNRIHNNGRDGFRVTTSLAQPVTMNVGFSRNVVSMNGGFGINWAAGINQPAIDCYPGWNVVTLNANPVGGAWGNEPCTVPVEVGTEENSTN